MNDFSTNNSGDTVIYTFVRHLLHTLKWNEMPVVKNKIKKRDSFSIYLITTAKTWIVNPFTSVYSKHIKNSNISLIEMT